MTTAAKKDVSLLPASIANKWKGTLSKLSYGLEQTRYWWVGDGPRVSLNGWTESFSYDDLADAAPVVTGSITLRQALAGSPIPRIQTGDLIIAEVRDSPNEAWQELIRMRVSEPERLASGQFTFQLANDASLLAMGTDSWHFAHDKAHKAGWRADQIVAEVCRRCRVRLVMPRLGKPIKKFPPMLNSSPVDVINAAMKHVLLSERKILVRRFVNGTLYVTERHYSPELMTIGPQLIDASLTETRRDGWATSFTVRTVAEKTAAKDSKGKKKATHTGIVVNVERSTFIRRYGYVHLIVYAHNATSIAQARAEGLAHMARVLNPKRELSLTSPFISNLRRGAYVRMAVGSLGLTQILFVSGISYSFSSGSLTMTVTCSFDDPVVTPPVDQVNQSSKATKKKPALASAKLDKPTATPPPKGTKVNGVVIINS